MNKIPPTSSPSMNIRRPPAGPTGPGMEVPGSGIQQALASNPGGPMRGSKVANPWVNLGGGGGANALRENLAMKAR